MRRQAKEQTFDGGREALCTTQSIGWGTNRRNILLIEGREMGTHICASSIGMHPIRKDSFSRMDFLKISEEKTKDASKPFPYPLLYCKSTFDFYIPIVKKNIKLPRETREKGALRRRSQEWAKCSNQ
jgi:hypothetical protein